MGDRVRAVTGGFVARAGNPIDDSRYGAFVQTDPSKWGSGFGTVGTEGFYRLALEPSRVVPVGAVNVPRSWGALACAFFGQPST